MIDTRSTLLSEAMTFELLHYDTANVLDDYASQDEALAAVRSIAERGGEAAIRTLSLAAIDAGGELHEIATGPALLTLAHRRIPA